MSSKMTNVTMAVAAASVLAVVVLAAVEANGSDTVGTDSGAEGGGAPTAFTGAIPPYDPAGGILYEVGDQACLKGLGNCAVYPKSAQLPTGRLVAAFERAVVPESGSADGLTMPIYASDDLGDTWEPLSEVEAPAYLSDDPAYDPYISNWTNPYLYVLPEDVGALAAGTLLLASVVSGEDEYYVEQKAADPTWEPDNDGDRRDMAIALFSSTDEGATWDVVNVIATGGWQGGSAGNIGAAIATANEHAQVDPLWEPFLMVYDGQLVAYYSDENDYLGYDPETGAPELAPDNDTGPDSHGQILVHRTWDGVGDWSDPVVDAAGNTAESDGVEQIGDGRPGMTTVVPTTDGKWMMTFEFWGKPAFEADNRYKVADNPLEFFADGDDVGIPVGDADNTQTIGLPFTERSQGLSWGGSPVTIVLPDGRLVYNAGGSGDLWVNESGASDGEWTQFNTTLEAGYSRNLQYVAGTGRIVILQGTWGGPSEGAVIRYGQVDLGHSDGPYFQVVNKATGMVLGTMGNITDAEPSGNVRLGPDVELENPGDFRADTQAWHVVDEGEGTVELLNQAGGRSLAGWGDRDWAGQDVAQWVDEWDGGRWVMEDSGDGFVRFKVAGAEEDLYLTGNADGDVLIWSPETDGTQDWSLEPVA